MITNRFNKKSDFETLKREKENQFPDVPKRFRKIIFLIFAVVAIFTYFLVHQSGVHKLTKARTEKRDKSIERTEKRNHEKENCEQYVLKVVRAGYYPVLQWRIKIANDSIYLNVNDVWKYGITCNGELERYPGRIYYVDNKYKLTQKHLLYETQHKGTEKECKIEEKRKIYNYPLLPECVVRERKLIRPPGHKNDN